LELLILAGIIIASQIEKFTPKKTDSLGIPDQCGFQILNAADVDKKLYPASIPADRGQPPYNFQGQRRFFLLMPPVFPAYPNSTEYPFASARGF
jgi:hypothetical protein